MKIARILTLSMLIAIAFTSCDKEDDPVSTPEPTALAVQTIVDLEARGYERNLMGDTINEFDPVYFDFSTGEVVDSTDVWDVAFKSTEIRLNGGSNGDQGVLAAIVDNTLAGVTTAPDDADMATDSPFGNAIFNAPSAGWWTYNAASFTVSPTPGKILVFKTAEGNHVKMEILNFYEGSPAEPNFMTDLDGFYTFDYVYQPNGTKNF